MGHPTLPAPVLLMTAICYHDPGEAEQIIKMLADKYGPCGDKSLPFSFNHTSYYASEMGQNLHKFFCAFTQTIDPMDIVDIKLFTNDLEWQFAEGDRRRVNIDPGYLEAPKLILATTKNFSHRIYLGKGIYGDVQLFWRHGRFQCNEWTYPDYREPQTIQFFTRMRNKYLQKGEHEWPPPTDPQV
ncbi:DUF4416 family protein [candidate division KSB1 bacterium]|nr:DUF4416 family protein [candidate division KSB1 bacterium]